MRFRASQRLRRTAEFEAVRERGFQINCGTFFFVILPCGGVSGRGNRRVGVVASRRVGNAVMRNRAKRRLREVFRLNQEHLPSGCDLVLIARRSLLGETYAGTEKRFLKACRRAVLRVGEGSEK